VHAVGEHHSALNLHAIVVSGTSVLKSRQTNQLIMLQVWPQWKNLMY